MAVQSVAVPRNSKIVASNPRKSCETTVVLYVRSTVYSVQFYGPRLM